MSSILLLVADTFDRLFTVAESEGRSPSIIGDAAKDSGFAEGLPPCKSNVASETDGDAEMP